MGNKHHLRNLKLRLENKIIELYGDKMRNKWTSKHKEHRRDYS